jgi:hypothetical protein
MEGFYEYESLRSGMGKHGLAFSGSGQGQLAGAYECGHER